MSLARIAVNANVAIHLRQMSRFLLYLLPRYRTQLDERLTRVMSLYAASFSLKKYVKEHWSPFFATFKDPPATNYEAKALIRELIFGGLSDPTRKIRLACVRLSTPLWRNATNLSLLQAAIISEIAHPDWPDDWPSLTTQLLTLISGSPNEVEGGMRVLNDFVGIDLTEDQLLPIARDLLPRLLTIVGMTEVRSASSPPIHPLTDFSNRPIPLRLALELSSSSVNAS